VIWAGRDPGAWRLGHSRPGPSQSCRLHVAARGRPAYM